MTGPLRTYDTLLVDKEHGLYSCALGPMPELHSLLHSDSTVFLKTHTGKHIDVEGDTVRAWWDDRGDWQTFVIEKEGVELSCKATLSFRGRTRQAHRRRGRHREGRNTPKSPRGVAPKLRVQAKSLLTVQNPLDW